MAGANYNMDNLCCIIDRNYLQISGSTEDVMALDSLQAKLQAFGWSVITVANGNDADAIYAALEEAKNGKEKPTCIIARTVKGKGSQVMENKANWHHKVPTAEQYDEIMRDLSESEVQA